jgi:hypothetical protein
MTTRKPKPTLSPQIEPLTEKLQLVVVTAKHTAPVRGNLTWQAEPASPAERSLPQRDKIVLH